MDLYEFYSGKCFDAYNELGAHVVKENVGKSRRKMVTGVDFVTYAPNAEAVTVTGEFNSWGETTMERCYDGSFFKCFIPGAKTGQMYKYKIYQRDGYCVDHCDPYGFGMELRPAFASIIRDMEEYTFGDARWMRTRNECKGGPLNVYEMHMGSWHCKPVYDENGKQLTAELLRKANLLPFAKNYTIVPMLFLKNAPKDDAGNAMLPEDVIELMK